MKSLTTSDHDSMLVTSDSLAQEKALFFDDLGSVYPPPKDDQDSKALFRQDPESSIPSFWAPENLSHYELHIPRLQADLIAVIYKLAMCLA